MTIKEMEEKAGLARANIRFYEAEGLFTPERKPNGYRDYSQEDLTTLLRVRLLRSLGVSLEDIKAVQAGDLPLAEVLGRHLDHLAEDKDKLTRAEGVCREMREAGEDYAHLDAEKYLEALTRPQPVPVPAPVPESDAIPKVRSPWRRFFARDLDAILYGMVLDGIFLACGLNHLIYTAFYSYGSSGQRNLMFFLAIGLGLLLTFVLEPVLLHWFGTTPGKARRAGSCPMTRLSFAPGTCFSGAWGCASPWWDGSRRSGAIPPARRGRPSLGRRTPSWCCGTARPGGPWHSWSCTLP